MSNNLNDKIKILALSDDKTIMAIKIKNYNIYGIQFHPEVTHTQNGKKLLKNFIFSICKSKKNCLSISCCVALSLAVSA